MASPAPVPVLSAHPRPSMNHPLSAALLCLAALVAVAHPTPAVAGPDVRPVSLRIHWGGGTPRAWAGRLAIQRPAGAAASPLPSSWRTLSTEPDAAALAHETATGLAIHQPHPIADDGIEITVADWQEARLQLELTPAASGAAAARVDLPIAELLASPRRQPLDGDGNRLVIEPAPGDALRVTLADGIGIPTAVRRPGDVLRFRVDPLLPVNRDEGRVELRMRFVEARQDRVIDAQRAPLTPLPQQTPAEVVTGRVPTPFQGIDFELSLPATEGVYEVILEAVERGGLRWTRPLATRTIQVAAIGTEPARPAGAEWDTLYELDPGSPRLHERLRRLPARGLASVPLPDLALPAMPLPSLSRPRMNLPRLPDVPLPDVAAMVPRLGGLLATGHSVIVPHELGPMLRLPPAPGRAAPTWEAIAVPGAQPDQPHLVEVDYPAAQRATVAVCVLEGDAAGGAVEVRYAGGFEATDGNGLATHRFIFWPTSRDPVVVLANPAADQPALIGKVRIRSGPAVLPAAAAAQGMAADGRPTFAFFPDPDLRQSHGGRERLAAGGGRPFADWSTHVAAIEHAANGLTARGLAGGVVTAYAEGAALWPSELTRHAARWDSAVARGSELDPLPKDILGAVVRVCDREGLAVIPAFRFDAAIPGLEAIRAGGDAAGIACLGSSGKPRQLPGGVHYNLLDPRVQQAVEAIVVEAAKRLAAQETSGAVGGMAVVLPGDGWLHLPGVAWGLDDATFGRFLETIGGRHAATGPERFAERAEMVRGPLREEWLAWRSGVITDFYARLAAAVAAVDDRWPLYVVPTTLFTDGELAARFEPSLTAGGPAPDLLREVGLPTSLPPEADRGGRFVFVSPTVDAAGSSLSDQSSLRLASGSLPLARAAAAARHRGVALVEKPLAIDVSEVVPHTPFAAATPPARIAARISPAASEGDRLLAQALVAADAEIVFDMRATASLPPLPSAARRAFESLPAAPMQLATDPPAPLVVRTRDTPAGLRIMVVNAAPAAAQARLSFTGPAAAVRNLVDGSSLPVGGDGVATLDLPAWGVQSLLAEAATAVEAIEVTHDKAVHGQVASRLERLRQRLAVLANPPAIDVLDNPGFELGLAEPPVPRAAPAITGWELVEPRRGSLALVAGLETAPGPDATGPAVTGRALAFSSRNGLSTLRSNPFPPPATGRVSVAAWLRIKPGDPQPPLRIAIEGIESGREYYRFAAIGGLTGGRPLTPEWSLFMLQVDHLPVDTIESLRVRFDLLGPGGVEIDEVRVFDLAFDEKQRNALASQVARIDHRFRQGDVGAALAGLETHWPLLLETLVDDTRLATLVRHQAAAVEDPAEPPPAAERQGMFDRLRGWWR